MQTLGNLAPSAEGSQLLSQVVEQVQDARDRERHRENLKNATTVSALQKAMRAAEKFLRQKDIEPYVEALAQMQVPYTVYLTTLAGERHEVEVKRTQKIRSLRELASECFGINLYRVAMTYDEKPLEPDDATLEACGICGEGIDIVTIIKDDEPWRDLSLFDFCEKLVQNRLASREEVGAMQRRIANGTDEEISSRALFFPRIRELAVKEQAAKERAAAQAEEILRWRAETLEQERRSAQLRHDTALPQRLEAFNELSSENLMEEAIIVGALPESAASHPSASYVYGCNRKLLVQHLACHRGIAMWKAEADRLTAANSGDLKSEVDVLKFEDLREEIEEDLDDLLYSLRSSEQVLASLNKQDIYEIRAFSHPPQEVVKVVEVLCHLMGIKLHGVAAARWQMAKTILASSQFLQKLLAIDKDSIDEEDIRRLERHVVNQGLNPTNLRRISESAQRLSLWMLALVTYHRSSRRVRNRRTMLSKVEAYLQAYHAVDDSQRAHAKQAKESILRLQSELARLSPLPRLAATPGQVDQSRKSVSSPSTPTADISWFDRSGCSTCSSIPFVDLS
jgi:hypothetical protein